MTAHRRGSFNVEALYLALDRQRRAQRISWRELGRAAGIGPSTLARVAYGHIPNLEAVIRLLRWLGQTDLGPYLSSEEAT